MFKEAIEIVNNWPNSGELLKCRELWKNNTSLLVSTFDTLSWTEFIDSRLNNLISRIGKRIG